MPTTTALPVVQVLRLLQRILLKPLRALTRLAWRCARWLFSRWLAESPPPQSGLPNPGHPESFLEYCGSHVPPSLDEEPLAVEINSQVDDSPVPAPQESRGPNMLIDRLAELDPMYEIQNTRIIGNLRPSESPPLLSSIHGIFPTAPELFNRYGRAETIVKQHTKLTIHPGKQLFARKNRVGWTAHRDVHPEGALYYVHDEKRIFTDAHLHIDTVFDTATAFIGEIERFYADNGMITSRRENGVDLVLDLVKSEDGAGETRCGYYFVDHPERIIFWDDAFELDQLSHGRGVTSAQHINEEVWFVLRIDSSPMIFPETELLVQFWRHCELFPSAIEVTSELIAELRDVLIHHIGDAMTSPTSTVADSAEDLLKMLTVVESMQENATSNTNLSGSACILGRFMWKFTSQMFYHFYGEPCARLDKTQSVYGHVPRHSLLIKIMAPILLNAPLTHLRMFEEEWQQLTLFATVLLNADIAFLAIPTVDNGEHTSRSAAQIATYVSVVASLGSVVVGLFLTRLNRDRRDAEDYVDEAADYLALHYASHFGFEPLAILYSLPFSLLMWGTFAFLVAFLDMCFQESNTFTRSLVASASFVTIFGIIGPAPDGAMRSPLWSYQFYAYLPAIPSASMRPSALWKPH
ncbi:hypothetical protein K438DRAFT_2022689 [Mycena galopus ATCC 62051]|nr:hypothetical protein K438DRAFT_2022689 [Mycena galopus ATCC 62051]